MNRIDWIKDFQELRKVEAKANTLSVYQVHVYYVNDFHTLFVWASTINEVDSVVMEMFPYPDKRSYQILRVWHNALMVDTRNTLNGKSGNLKQ